MTSPRAVSCLPVPRRRRRGVAALALLGGLLLPLAAQAAELVLAVARTPLSLPVFVAEAQDYFRAEGVAVRSVDCVGGQACMKLMFGGSAQLATASDLPVMFNSFERSDYAVLATFVSATHDAKLIARGGSGIASARQLAGKRVATVPGSSAHYYLDAFLLYHGVDPALVTVVPLPADRMPEALRAGQVDAVAVYEPWAWLSRQAVGADAAVVLPNPRIYTLSFNLVADRRSIAAHDEELQRVLRALARAVRFIQEQPAAAQEVMKRRLQLDQPFVDWVWPHLDYRLGLDQSLVTTVEHEARWALREGHVPAGRAMPKVLNLLAPDTLRKAVPGAVTITR